MAASLFGKKTEEELWIEYGKTKFSWYAWKR